MPGLAVEHSIHFAILGYCSAQNQIALSTVILFLTIELLTMIVAPRQVSVHNQTLRVDPGESGGFHERLNALLFQQS
jgi:hypothetical protein